MISLALVVTLVKLVTRVNTGSIKLVPIGVTNCADGCVTYLPLGNEIYDASINLLKLYLRRDSNSGPPARLTNLNSGLPKYAKLYAGVITIISLALVVTLVTLVTPTGANWCHTCDTNWQK